MTDAAVHDSQELDGLLDEGNTCNDVFADNAYRSAEIEAKLRASGYNSRIHRRGRQNHPLSSSKSERTTPRAGYALVSSMCSGRSRARRAIVRRLAWCGRAPRSACRTWPTTFAAGDVGTARRGMKVVESSALFQPKQRTEKREAVTTANQSNTGPNPNSCSIRRQNRPLLEVPLLSFLARPAAKRRSHQTLEIIERSTA